jgi:hypothetical protein
LGGREGFAKSHSCYIARDCSQAFGAKRLLCNKTLMMEIEAKKRREGCAGFKQITAREQCHHTGQAGMGVPGAGGSTHGSLYATLVLCSSHVRIPGRTNVVLACFHSHE